MATQPNSTGSRVLLKDEGSPLGRVIALDAVGAGITASLTGSTGTLNVPGGGGSTITPTFEVPSGSRPGTMFTVSASPLGTVVLVNLNNQWLAKAVSTPGVDEYTISGTTITTGAVISAGDKLFAFYLVTGGAATTPHFEAPSGSRPGTVFTLSSAPSSSIVLVNLNNMWLTSMGALPGVDEYTISGSTITLGAVVSAGDKLFAFWLS